MCVLNWNYFRKLCDLYNTTYVSLGFIRHWQILRTYCVGNCSRQAVEAFSVKAERKLMRKNGVTYGIPRRTRLRGCWTSPVEMSRHCCQEQVLLAPRTLWMGHAGCRCRGFCCSHFLELHGVAAALPHVIWREVTASLLLCFRAVAGVYDGQSPGHISWPQPQGMLRKWGAAFFAL